MRTKLFLLIIFFSGVVMAAPSKQFVVFHKKGKNWPAEGLSFDQPIAQEHAEYFGSLHEKGIVVRGGPFPGKSGGMMVFKEGVTEAEVLKYAKADPAVKGNVMDFEVKLWMQVFGK